MKDTRRLYKGDKLFASELTSVYDGNGQELSEWTITRDGVDVTNDVAQPKFANGEWTVENVSGDGDASPVSGLEDDTSIVWTYTGDAIHQYVATRSENKFLGYAIAGQTDKPLVPSDMLDELSGVVDGKASKPSSPTNGNIATLDANGDLVDSGLNAAKVDERISTMRQACEVLWWDDPSKYSNKAGGAGRIFFRPREVGMWDGGCISVINFHTANTTAINANIYLKLVSSNQQTVYATSDTKSINGTNIWVPFTFTTYAPLEKDTQYVLQFIDASTGSVHGNIRPTLQPWTDSPDLYFVDTTNRPHITVRWLMDLTSVKEKLEDHESRIQALETAIANMAS